MGIGAGATTTLGTLTKGILEGKKVLTVGAREDDGMLSE